MFKWLVFASLASAALADVCQWHTGPREACGPEDAGTETSCVSAGCCWRTSNVEGEPWCFTRAAEAEDGALKGHIVKSVEETATGLHIMLESTADTVSTYGPLISSLQVDIIYETADRVRWTIKDANNARYEIPEDVFGPLPEAVEAAASPNYAVAHAAVGELFWIQVTRADDGEMLFNSKDVEFEFTPQYLTIGSQVPETSGIYGMGERAYDFRLPEGRYPIHTNDAYGTPFMNNLYSSHPVYMQLSEAGKAFMVYMHSSATMDFVVRNSSVSYRMIGGIMDMYLFVGPTPAVAVQQYGAIAGLPVMPPRWSVGLHQCRYGYPSLDFVKGVVANYSEAQIPLDTIWVDIDHMEEYQVFTFDEELFPPTEMNEFMAELGAKNMHSVPILDPAVKFQNDNAVYLTGLTEPNSVYVKHYNGTDYVGAVWPGESVWPDFFDPAARAWWAGQMDLYLESNEVPVPFSGLWVDMNEPASFCDGPCDGNFDVELQVNRSGYPFWPNKPPYSINNGGSNQPLWWKTLSMDAQHKNGELWHYDVHNLYGIMMARATYDAMVDLRGVRPFILSRSTFVGSGKYAAHWSGDNQAEWSHLEISIMSVLSFNLFHIPNTGVDICGFAGNTTMELCTRWAALGAFYPFSRNHNGKGHTPNEFYSWPETAAVARKYYSVRYQISPLLYTLLQDSHEKGTTVWRPLFFEFPEDVNTHPIQKQAMVGDTLLLSPVVTENATSVDAYIPAGIWYDLLTMWPTHSEGEWMTLPAPLDFIPVHIRGGSIMTAFTDNSLTMTDTWADHELKLIIALDANHTASGDVFFDDGETIEPTVWHRVSYDASATGLTSSIVTGPDGGFLGMKDLVAVDIAGLPTGIESATVNGEAVLVDQMDNHVTLHGFSAPLSAALNITWTLY